MTGERALIGQAEVERATAVIESWREREIRSRIGTNELLELRGMIAAALAAAYSDGYVAGIQRGKVETIQRVMECLREL